jgi:hypothetical protein
VEFEDSITDNDRMSSIVSTLKTSNPSRLFSEPIDEFAFAFIAPLCT